MLYSEGGLSLIPIYSDIILLDFVKVNPNSRK